MSSISAFRAARSAPVILPDHPEEAWRGEQDDARLLLPVNMSADEFSLMPVASRTPFRLP
jgi:hypothetical protein